MLSLKILKNFGSEEEGIKDLEENYDNIKNINIKVI